jgi:heme exporter protein D
MGEGFVLMQFSSWAEFFYMGGHGQYVWLAYAISFVICLLLVIVPLLKKRGIKKAIKQRQRFERESAT